jgi:hypothetical protein
MLQPGMASITILKLQLFHEIGSKILFKGNKTIMGSLTNLQRQKILNTTFVITQRH